MLFFLFGSSGEGGEGGRWTKVSPRKEDFFNVRSLGLGAWGMSTFFGILIVS